MAKQMRKTRTGSVVRTSMEQTAVVELVWKQRHRVYQKQMRRVSRYYVHDPESLCQVGDTVRIQETRPISKTKHWRLLEILQRRQVADVLPIELETDIVAEITGTDDFEDSEAELENLVGDDAEAEAEDGDDATDDEEPTE
ncbi:MAG: 30S ribosomal protein S17 [Dehalococcoidia bacterium]